MHITAAVACQLFVESLRAIFPDLRSFKGIPPPPFLNKSDETCVILPTARGDLLADRTQCHRATDNTLGAPRWPAARSSLSMHRPNTCKIPSHPRFFRRSVLTQSRLGKGRRQRLHAFTRHLLLKEQRGSRQALQANLRRDLATSPPQSAIKVHHVLMKCEALGEAKEEGYSNSLPAISISLFRLYEDVHEYKNKFNTPFTSFTLFLQQ